MEDPLNERPKFKPVTRAFDIQSGSRSKEEESKVYPSGRTPLNVRGTQILDKLAVEAGQSLTRYNTRFEADDVNNLVAVYIAQEVVPGVLPARRSTDGRTVSIHLGGVFEEYPTMRPSSRRSCQVWRDVDAKGNPYMAISLGTGLSTRTNTRDHNQSTQA